MLRITLYKNCILNETYANVFSLGKINDETILERYLNTLYKKVYEVDCVYQENSGQLVFDYVIDTMNNIYDFNYMKIETIDDEDNIKILRYCFIQEISLKNELVYLSYAEDMWHSYIGKITGINESYLEKSRVRDFEHFRCNHIMLPLEYSGNNKLLIDNIKNPLLNKLRKCYIIAEFQIYKKVQAGQMEHRETKYVLLSYRTEKEQGGITTYTYHTLFNINETISGELDANQVIQYLIGNQSSATENYSYRRDASSTYNANYEIGNIYCIPEEFDIQKIFKVNETTINAYDEISLKEPFSQNDKKLYGIPYASDLIIIDNIYHYYIKGIDREIIYNHTLINDFKNKLIGTITNPLIIENNGTDIEFKITISITNLGFKLFAEYLNKVIDITQDFSVDIPFTSVSSSENQLRGLQRQIKATQTYNNAWIEQLNSGINQGTYWKKSLTDFASFRYMSGMIDIAQTFAEPMRNKLKIENYAVENIANDASAYTTMSAVFSNSSEGIINAYFGICLFKINPDNEEYIKKLINNFGYITFEFIKDISEIGINNPSYFLNLPVPINYNSIKFKYVSVYGSFARNIALNLNKILMEGVKIWYTETLQDDNYEVG